MCNIYLFCVVNLLLFAGVWSYVYDPKICFPPGFKFGVATAAYQVEGAWNVSGKGESIWDRYTHQHPELVFDHNNGDLADGSYYKIKEDVQLLKKLGVDFYRFSISWPRILPTGLSNEVNEDGIRYYRALLNELARNKIMPLVTMYHWDLPQKLQDLGGWTNPIVADYFVDYARVLFDRLGDKINLWLTFNEPLSFCHDGYGGLDAPGARSSGMEDYMCGHNVLRAHGMVYQMFDQEHRPKYGGRMGIVLDMSWFEPNTTSEADKVAAETAIQFTFGWFANPILSQDGDYPPVMRKQIDAKSKQQGFSRSRLPTFTKDEVDMIHASVDFLGLNHYTTRMATPARKSSSGRSFEDDMNVVVFQKDEWPKSNSTWLKVVPWGFRKALNWIKNSYNNPPLLVTENGISTVAGLHDTKRVNYIDSYLKMLQKAIAIDKCNVVGYTYWSLMDNFEWMRGYSERFGLFEVDYTSSNLTRTARLSASYFTRLTSTGCLPVDRNDYVFSSSEKN